MCIRDSHQRRWDLVWEDPVCQKYRHPEHEDHFLWGHAFFEAPVDDLRHIAALIGARAVSSTHLDVYKRQILYAAAAQIYQAMQYIDRQGKQSLLKYSYSDFLDNLAIFKGVTRNQATAATCTLRFTLSAERETATAIPQGTRVASSGAVYFATDEYLSLIHIFRRQEQQGAGGADRVRHCPGP